VLDLKTAVDERNAVIRQYLGIVQSPPQTPGMWPSVYWLGALDLWLLRGAMLPGAPSEQNWGSSAGCYFVDPYVARGTSFEYAFRSNVTTHLTWTNAMRYAGLTNSFNFTHPTWVFNPATYTWSTATNRPFWLRRSDLDERRRVLNLLRWTREDEYTGGTNVWRVRQFPEALECPAFPSCEKNTPVEALPSEYEWVNTPVAPIPAWWNTMKWRLIADRDFDETPPFAGAGIAARMDGIGHCNTGNVDMVFLRQHSFWPYRINVLWPSNYYLRLQSQPTNYANQTDVYAQWETNVLAAIDTQSYTKILHESSPHIFGPSCSVDWTPVGQSEMRTNSQPQVTWPLPLKYTLDATGTKAKAPGASRTVVLGNNVPDHEDLVLTNVKHEFDEPSGDVTNTVEELAVVIPVWQLRLADPLTGPILSLAGVSRWDVTNGFQMVWPLE
jgi:hypothetical protein